MSATLSILGLGFALGMRHATDPDHVVAVTTIVARERRIWASTLVGALWGLGHTSTLLLVGGASLLRAAPAPAAPGAAAPPSAPPAGAPRMLRPVLVGVVHGLAGSAGIALLVLATLGDARWGAAYLLVFGVGTVAGMVVVTTLIALPFTYAAERLRRAHVWLQRVTGVASALLGLWMAYALVVG